jgi:ubiquinone biosynthesis protein COQ9
MLIDSIENKQKILENFIKLCAFNEVSEETLLQAFQGAKIDPKFALLIFENGAESIVEFWLERIDAKMLQDAQEVTQNIDFSQMKIRDKITNLLQIRVKINQEYQEQLPQLIKFFSCPKNINLAFKNAYKVADLMWQFIGDKSTDFNFYSKRAILAKIYIRSTICLAGDKSSDCKKTFALIDKEIEKVMQFTAFKFKIRSSLQKLADLKPDLTSAAEDLCKNPKNFIKKLPFFRLYR